MDPRESRREFLLTLARAAAFVPQALVTLDVASAAAQGKGGGGGRKCSPGFRWNPKTGQCEPVGNAPAPAGLPPTVEPSTAPSPRPSGLPPAPWDRPPGGGQPPP